MLATHRSLMCWTQRHVDKLEGIGLVVLAWIIAGLAVVSTVNGYFIIK